MPISARFDREHEQRSAASAVDRAERAHDARAERQADTDADERGAADAGARIFFERAHQAEQQDRHRDRERRVLRVHEHVPVILRAGRQQDERDQAGERAADAAADPPDHEQSEDADRGAEQPARLEHAERQNLRERRREEVEAAAVIVEIDERQRARSANPEV